MVMANPKYHVTDLSALAEGSAIVPSTGYAINNAGQITGHGMPTAAGSTSKVFLYDPVNGFINVGNLNGNFVEGNGGNGYSINQQGVIVGRNCISDTVWAYRPFLFYDANANGVVDVGEHQNLGTEPGYGTGVANDINDFNQVVGYISDETATTVGWVWTDANANLQFDTGEKQYFGAWLPNSINNVGQIVLSNGTQCMLWDDLNSDGVYDVSEQQMFGLPATYPSFGTGYINNSGAVCGAIKNGNAKTNAFYWEDSNSDGIIGVSEYTIFGALATNTFVRSFNDQGQAVGGTFDFNSAQRTGYVWSKDKGMENLNTLTDFTDAVLGRALFSQAEGINHLGVITATGWYDTDEDGRKDSAEAERVFVLTPYSAGDITTDGLVNLEDFSDLAEQYGRSDCAAGNEHCGGADIGQNGSVGLDDVAVIAEKWLTTIL
jgi:hypothetical protein